MSKEEEDRGINADAFQIALLQDISKTIKSQIPLGIPANYNMTVTVQNPQDKYEPDYPLFAVSITNDGVGDVSIWVNDEGDELLLLAGDAPLQIDFKTAKISLVDVKLINGASASLRIRGVR